MSQVSTQKCLETVEKGRVVLHNVVKWEEKCKFVLKTHNDFLLEVNQTALNVADCLLRYMLDLLAYSPVMIKGVCTNDSTCQLNFCISSELDISTSRQSISLLLPFPKAFRNTGVRTAIVKAVMYSASNNNRLLL